MKQFSFIHLRVLKNEDYIFNACFCRRKNNFSLKYLNVFTNKRCVCLELTFRPIRLMWEKHISQSFNKCQSLYTIGCQSFISDRKAGFQLLVWTTREKMSEYDTNLYRIEVISVKPICWELNRTLIKVFGNNSLKIFNYYQILVESNFRTFETMIVWL